LFGASTLDAARLSEFLNASNLAAARRLVHSKLVTTTSRDDNAKHNGLGVFFLKIIGWWLRRAAPLGGGLFARGGGDGRKHRAVAGQARRDGRNPRHRRRVHQRPRVHSLTPPPPFRCQLKKHRQPLVSLSSAAYALSR
jgi:cytochrome b